MNINKYLSLFLLYILSITIVNILINIVSKDSTVELTSGNQLYTIDLDNHSNISNGSNNNVNPFIFGPYINLYPGIYRISYLINKIQFDEIYSEVTFDISVGKDGLVLKSDTINLNNIPLGNYTHSFDLDLKEPVSDFQTRIFTNSNAIQFHKITIEPISTRYLWPWELIDVKLLVISFVLVLIIIAISYIISKQKLFFIVVSILFLVLGVSVLIPKHGITGDEPHYLINMKNMLVNNTLNLKSGYQNTIKSEFWKGDIDIHAHESIKTGELFSQHGYLTSLLLIPGYLLGGLSGVRYEITLIAFSVIWLQFLVFLKISRDKFLSLFTTILMCFTTPYIFYTYSIYPEIFAAFIFIFSIFSGLKRNFFLEVSSMLLLGLSLLLNIKYLFPAGILATWILIPYFSIIKDRFNLKLSKKGIILFLCFLVTFSTFFILNFKLYGNFYLFSNYTGGTDYTFSESTLPRIQAVGNTLVANIFGNRAGILIWIPSLILSFIGVIKSIKNGTHGARRFIITISGSVILYYIFYSISGSIGGGSPPLRPWIAVLPLIYILFLKGLAVVWPKKMITIIILLTFSVYQIIGSYVYKTDVINIYGHQINPFYTKTGTTFANLGLLFPKTTSRIQIETFDVISTMVWLLLFVKLGIYFDKRK